MTLAALQLGLRYDEALDLPLGNLLDLVNADRIRRGARPAWEASDTRQDEHDDAAFWALMERS